MYKSKIQKMAHAPKFGSKAAVADPTRIPPGIDSSTFLTPHISDEIRAAVPLMHQTSPEILRAAVKIVCRCLNSKLPEEDEFIAIQTKLGQQGEHFGLLVTGFYAIIKAAVATKTPIQTINSDLKSMNLPAAAADSISEAVRIGRTEFESRALVNRVGFPRLSKFRWRIDVTISSGSLSRVMRPSMTMQVNHYAIDKILRLTMK